MRTLFLLITDGALSCRLDALTLRACLVQTITSPAEVNAAHATIASLRVSCRHTCEVSLKIKANAPKFNKKAILSYTEMGSSSRRLKKDPLAS